MTKDFLTPLKYFAATFTHFTGNYINFKSAPMPKPQVYDSIEIEDMTWDSVTQCFYYPCPCGDQFQIHIEDLREGEEIAQCPSCSLLIEVVFDAADLDQYE